VDDQIKPPLADDPAFLASLGELDDGMDGTVPKRAPAPPPVRPLVPKQAAPPPPRQSAPSPPRLPAPPPVSTPPASHGGAPTVPRQGGGRRALLDLFPPTPTAPPASKAPPMFGAPAAPSSKPSAPPRLPAARLPTLTDVLAARVDAALTYETFYGLTEPPFSSSSDPKFLYHSTAHDRVAQELLNAIRRRDGIVIVTGEVGMGKTMLCRAVLDQLDRRTLTSFVLDPSASVEEILQTILVDFGVISRADLAGGRLAQASRHDLMHALREFLASLAPLQAFAVVIVDDAHKLAADVLDQIRALSDADAERRLLQVVLVGQPRLLTILRRPELRQLAQRAAVRCVLEPLDDDEIVGYVLHRLTVAGSNARVEFDDDAFGRLFVLSAGVPRIINQLCDRALTLGYDASASVIDLPLVDRAAEDLDITPPESEAARLVRAALTMAALVVLMLAGAGAAAFVFHDRLAQTIVRWEAVPPAPRQPTLRQPAPFAPPPPPAATPAQPPTPRK
jgi:type II secretory pathway predicted ATPase ExeA